MAHILIVGIGNPLRMDDGIGHFVAGRLADRYARDDRVTAIDCHQLTPDLAETVAESEEVFFLDASMAGTPGELKVHELPTTDPKNPLFDAHNLSPHELIELAGRLYGRRPRGRLFTLSGKHFGFGEGLSDEVARSLGRMEEEVVALAADRLYMA